MKQTSKTLRIAAFCGAAASAMLVAGTASAQTPDEIVVTSQRQSENLQDVPLSVSAFDANALQARQIESFTDVQLATPNFSFTRTQFTGSSIVLRGIGALAVGADSEPSVSIHLNDQPLSAPRLFETEFFDVERVEILRGPQGTLFGRNATGGVVNVITNKASTAGVEAFIEGEYGNFDSQRLTGSFNLPINDSLAVRVAGIAIQRDGYTENLYTGTDIDDRDMYGVRGSVRWYPTERTTIDAVYSFFQEDDSRARASKALCEADPTGLRGCVPDGLGFDSPTTTGTLAILASQETFGLLLGPSAAPFGLFSVSDALGLTSNGIDTSTIVQQPADLRQVALDFDPRYFAEESIFNFNIQHDLDTLTFKLIGGWANSRVRTQQDFSQDVGPEFSLNPALGLFFPNTSTAILPNGTIATSGFDAGLAGSIGGSITNFSDRLVSVDLSSGDTSYWSIEGNVASDFDGPINFLAGVNYLDTEGYADYYVGSNALDYTAHVGGALAASSVIGDLNTNGLPDEGDGLAGFTPIFLNDGASGLESLSFFGEVYIDFNDRLKLTLGGRYNDDTKSIQDNAFLFDSLLGAVPSVVPLGTTDVLALLDPDPSTEGTPGAINEFRVAEQDFQEFTGRAVLDWQATDGALLYASFSRGYKPGGFNAPQSTSLPGLQAIYDPEFINAYEIGAKLTGFFNGALTANLAAFYYDYEGLQVSRILNRTSINDNTDATVYGLEGEFFLRPTDNWLFNATLSYLNTEIGDFSAFDPADPAGDDPNAILLKDLSTGSNCVLQTNGAPNPLGSTITGTGDPALDAQATALLASQFTVCSALQGILPILNAGGANYEVIGGVDQSLEGNELPGSPEFSVALGAQYTHVMGNGVMVTPRVDYYWQDEFYSRTFNTTNDLVESWDVLNAQLMIEPTDGPWYIRLFVQNALDDEQITGQFLQDQSAGLNSYIFLQEPRRFGGAIGVRF